MSTHREGRRRRESTRDRDERGRPYHDDRYASRDTPRTEGSVERYTEQPSGTRRAQFSYRDSSPSLAEDFENLRVDSPERRPYYTTDPADPADRADRYYGSTTGSTTSYPSELPYTVPHQASVVTPSTTYSNPGYVASYEPTERSRETAQYPSAVTRGAASSDYYAISPPAYSTSPPTTSSAYSTNAYSSPPPTSSTYSADAYSSPPLATSADPIYSTSPQAAGSAITYSPPQSIGRSITWSENKWDETRQQWYTSRRNANGKREYHYYPRESEAVSTAQNQASTGYESHQYNAGQQPQPPVSQYIGGGAVTSTVYSTSPTYSQQGSTYASNQFSPIPETYNQTTAETQTTSAYTVGAEGRNPILPVPIAQCGCLGCDRDNLPKLRDGKDDRKKSSKKGDSSRSKHSSKNKESALSTSVSFEIQPQGASGSNCGALYLTDIKPWPKPRHSDYNDDDEYNTQLARWREDWRKWRDTSCPCRYGYFGEDAVWISGSHVRLWLKNGRGNPRPGEKRGNPRWERNEWKAPEQPKPGRSDLR